VTDFGKSLLLQFKIKTKAGISSECWCESTKYVVLHPSSLSMSTVYSVIRQVYSLFPSELTKQCNLVLSLSISSNLSFPWRHPVAVYVFILVFLSLPFSFLCPSTKRFRRMFLSKTLPIKIYFLLFIVCKMFLSFLTRLTLLHFSHDRSNWFSPSSPAAHFKTFNLLLLCFPNCQVPAPHTHTSILHM
jgi:hypothetical protein